MASSAETSIQTLRMTKRPFILLLFIPCICCLFSKCMVSYGNDISRQYTQLAPDTSHVLPRHKSVLIYFDGEPINFAYDKRGIIEVKGNQFASTDELLNHLKYEALKNGANAVIAVKDGYATRQSGLIFSKTPPTEYSSHIYSGIAVKLKDEDHYNVLMNKADTNFIKKVQLHDTSNAKKAGNEVVGSFILVLLLVGVGIYAVATK